MITAEEIVGSTCVGAICGATYDVAIESCVTNCTLTSSGHKAGFVGRAYAGNSGHEIALSKCYNVTNLSEAYTTGATLTISLKSVEHFADKEQLNGSKAYQKTLLSFYDKNTNADAKWVLITDKLPELRSFTRMVSTSIYYKVCEDIIKEVAEVFGYPEYFHLGMDEETARNQTGLAFCCIRQKF